MLNAVRKLRSLGYWRFLRCFFARFRLRLLRYRFGFNPWHSSAPAVCRPYKEKLCKEILGFHPKHVLEIGCGLGDIGRLLETNIDSYLGLDLCSGAIAAAQHLSKGREKLAFSVGSFERMADYQDREFDTCILLAWTHEMPSEELVSLIHENIDRHFRYIVLDVLTDPTVDRFQHFPEKLAELGFKYKLVHHVSHLDEVRDLCIFQNCDS